METDVIDLSINWKIQGKKRSRGKPGKKIYHRRLSKLHGKKRKRYNLTNQKHKGLHKMDKLVRQKYFSTLLAPGD